MYTHGMTTEQEEPETDRKSGSEDQAPADSHSVSGDSDTADEPPAPNEVEASDETDESPDDADALEADPDIDTGPLERSQAALDEARDAAHEALSDPRPDDDDMDFENVEQNTDPEADDNAVPRPN